MAELWFYFLNILTWEKNFSLFSTYPNSSG